MKTRTLLFFVFSLIFLSNCFSMPQVTRYYPKELTIYPASGYAKFYYYVNITYKNVPKNVCNNTSVFKDYKPYIFGEVNRIYPPNATVNISLIRIKSGYVNKTCLVSIEYGYMPTFGKNGSIVYVPPLVLNPYPDVFDTYIVNLSNLFYRIDDFVICLPKIYTIKSVEFKKYKIYFAFNKTNYPISLFVLNISNTNTPSKSYVPRKVFDKGLITCYKVMIPYTKPKPEKIGNISIYGLNYDLYSFESYGVYGIVVEKINVNKQTPTKTQVKSKHGIKKIYIIVLFILVIIIVGLLYYYIRKGRGEW